MELILIRHACPMTGDLGEGMAAERQGQSASDPGLSEAGIDQARAVAAWLSRNPPDRLVSSPARRARETAKASEQMFSKEAAIDARLSDANPSPERYVPLEEDQARDAAAYRRRLAAYQEGAQIADASTRVNAALDEWTQKHPGFRVAVFCHGSVVNVYAARVLGLEQLTFFHAEYASAHRFMISRDGIRSVKSLNETAYLS